MKNETKAVFHSETNGWRHRSPRLASQIAAPAGGDLRTPRGPAAVTDKRFTLAAGQLSDSFTAGQSRRRHYPTSQHPSQPASETQPFVAQDLAGGMFGATTLMFSLVLAMHSRARPRQPSSLLMSPASYAYLRAN